MDFLGEKVQSFKARPHKELMTQYSNPDETGTVPRRRQGQRGCSSATGSCEGEGSHVWGAFLQSTCLEVLRASPTTTRKFSPAFVWDRGKGQSVDMDAGGGHPTLPEDISTRISTSWTKFMYTGSRVDSAVIKASGRVGAGCGRPAMPLWRP